MRHRILYILVFLSISSASAQKEASNWYFGGYAGLRFSNGSVSALTNSAMYTLYNSATASAVNGKLLFYTDGMSVWDSTHNKMSNGTGLYGGPSTYTPAIIVPNPDSSNILYIITTCNNGTTLTGLYYSVIDMKLNSGKGNVVAGRKNILLRKKHCGKLAAIKHSNRNDYWVLAPENMTDTINAFLITSSGVNQTPVRSKLYFPPHLHKTNPDMSYGQMKISPNGKKVAFVAHYLDSGFLGDFNDSTGEVSKGWHFFNPWHVGLEFSPNSKYMYVSDGVNDKVYQYNVITTSGAAFRASRFTVDSNYVNSSAQSLQLGPDGKIYIALPSLNYLSVISAPDSAGYKCRPKKNYVYSGSMNNWYELGLPTYVQSLFQLLTINYTRNCLNDTTFFSVAGLSRSDSLNWSFGDTASGSKNRTNKTTNIFHVYKKAGNYPVRLISFYKKFRDTVNLNLWVKDPKPYLGKDTAACNTFLLVLQPKKNYISYKWNNDSLKKKSYVRKKGTYILNVKDSSGCLSADTIVVSNPKLKAGFILSDTINCFKQNAFLLKDTSSYKEDKWKKSTWFFGDGTNQSDTVVKKVFQDTGIFAIKLVLNSSEKCKDSVVKKVRILPSTKIGFTINRDKQCFNGHNFSFTNTSTILSGNIAAYNWRLGDDSVSAKKDISGKKYMKDSSYSIRLITVTERNCKDTLTKNIWVYPNANVGCTISKTSQCHKNNSTDFINTSKVSSGTIVTNWWTFGDGDSSTSKDKKNKTYWRPDRFGIGLLTITDKGCRDSLTRVIYIYENARIAFDINKADQCFNGHSFNFTNKSVLYYKNNKDTITNYYWSFGDDSASLLKDFTNKTYNKDSSYKVRLISKTDKNCYDTLTKIINVFPNSKVNYSILKPVQCFKQQSFDINNISTVRTGNISTYYWNFGDGQTSIQKQIAGQKYNTHDSFVISLLAITDKGCRDSISKKVYVYPSSDVKFLVNKDSQCFKWNKFNFTNLSSIVQGSIKFNWDMGDGTFDTSSQVGNKQYSTSGLYDVKLITTSDKNCKDTFIKRIKINASPVASFSVNADRQCFKNNAFNLTNSTLINNGLVISQNWSMGDGKSFTTPNVTGYNYLSEDSFNVRLVSLSDRGCYDTTTHLLVTYAQPIAKYIVPNDSQCWQKHYFNIINQSTIKYGVMNHSWSFGDNTNDYTYNPTSKKYANSSAKYTIRYNIVSDHGCKDSMSHKINLLERPIADFSINDSVQCFKNHNFSFGNKTTFSAMNTLSYYWDYGNGNKSTGINPLSAVYPSAGYHPVQLIAYSYLSNCYDTLVQKILVAPHAKPNYTIDKDSQCLRLNLFKFTDASTLEFGQMAYKWDFRDGDTSVFQNPLHKFKLSSSYFVRQIIRTDRNCFDSIEKEVVILPHPEADFTINDSSQCFNNHSYDMINKTTIKWGNLLYQWLLDNGGNSLNKDILSQQLKIAGMHKIILAVNSNHNCTDTVTKFIYLELPKSSSIVLNSSDSQCLRLNRFNMSVKSNNPLVFYSNYNWVFGDGNINNTANPIYSFKKEGVYSVMCETISKNGCRDSAYQNVVVHPHPVSNYNVIAPCFPSEAQFSNSSVIASGKIVTNIWDLGDGTQSNILHPVHYYKSPGNFVVKLITISGYGCSDTLIRNNGIWVKSKPFADFKFTRLADKEFGLATLKFDNKSSGDANAFEWEFGNGNTSNQRDPEIDFVDTNSRIITLISINADGCSDTISKTTGILYTDFRLYLPEVFSPDDNNLNEEFKPVATPYVHKYIMEIFNRWGEKVFETNDITKGWDGTYNGMKCPEGVYICRLFVMPKRGGLLHHEITLTLLR